MSDPGNQDLPDRTRRQLAGECLYGRCKRLARDGADFCPEHHEAVKAWKRDWATKQRRAIRKAKQCRDCGKASKRVRCKSCSKAYSKTVKARRVRVEHASVRVEHAAKAPRTKLEVHPDGYTRVRTIGRGVRGQKSRADLDEDLRTDLSDALADAQWVRDEGIADLRTVAVEALGRIAQREAKAIVADRLLRAVRTLTVVADALCPGRVAEVAAELASIHD